jgi:UDP-3-O-[3-hydroxymyristoyl] N-acetylglucosamine deacetylase
MQHTIKKEIKARGVGIHYNKIANLTLKPAEIDSGIIIKRVDVKDRENTINAHYSSINDTFLSTKLTNSAGVGVATVEHLLSALFAFKITNLIVEIDELELPIMEGGSEDFCFMIECAGIVEQPKQNKKFIVLKELQVGDEKSYIKVKPSPDFHVHFVSNFHSHMIGEQKFSFNKNVDFMRNVAPARTIANSKEVEALHSAGYGLGGNLKNTLVFDSEGILNEACSYNKDDFVKHKILDFVGDVYLAGGEVIGDFECFKSGHKLNHLLLKEIFSKQENYKTI